MSVRRRESVAALTAVAAVVASGLAAVGCRRLDPPPAHRARGVLMFEPAALANADGGSPQDVAEARRTFLANQIAILKSDRVVGSVRHDIWGDRPGQDPIGGAWPDVAQLRSAITASTHEPGLAIDVIVDLWADPPAVRACDAVMEALIRYRLDDRTDAVVRKLEWMNAQLTEMSKDAGKHAAALAALRREIDDLDRQRSRLATTSDVRVLNRCVALH